MDKEIYFEITDGPDIIRIQPLSWTHSNADLDWDKNCIHSKITVNGGAFRGQFNCNLMTTDFELLKRESKKIYDNLNGTAEFKTFEEQLKISMHGDGLGYFEIDCEALDEPGTGNILRMRMAFDQTYIPDLVRQLDKIIKEFPIQGTDLKVRN